MSSHFFILNLLLIWITLSQISNSCDICEKVLNLMCKEETIKEFTIRANLTWCQIRFKIDAIQDFGENNCCCLFADTIRSGKQEGMMYPSSFYHATENALCPILVKNIVKIFYHSASAIRNARL